MAMVNPMLSPAPVMAPVGAPAAMKDSRWLTLEVCREYQRNKCSRSELECKFAHPPAHVEVQNGRVTCCFDSIKGKCQRNEPPCKYLHPPQHLREQLLQNGRNNLIMKSFQMQAIAAGGMPVMSNMFPTMTNPKALPYQSAVMPGHYPTVVAPPYMLPSAPAYPHYMNPAAAVMAGMPAMMASMDGGAATSVSPMIGMIPSPMMLSQKVARPDRLEPSSQASSPSLGGAGVVSGGSDAASWTTGPLESVGPASHYSPVYFQGMSAMPGMVPMVKRAAIADSKSGIPMYQPSAGNAAYQQAALAMQLQQQPFVPVTMPMMAGMNASMVSVAALGGHTVMPVAAAAAAVGSSAPLDYEEASQWLDTLPVCRDFKLGLCKRPQCKYIHLLEDYVEVADGKVTLCRDAAKGKCTRPMCKYYHMPAAGSVSLLPQLRA